jgi:tRNA threonylcarbamoyladenosine biosynthesis protein TsaB
MLILTIRTDKPNAEIGLFDDDSKLAYSAWLADRQLAETIHLKIKELLQSQSYELDNLRGILVFKGPGSFTGLRIGISVANALAYGLEIPIIAETGDNWLKQGIDKLTKAQNEEVIIPEYGSPPNITLPSK